MREPSGSEPGFLRPVLIVQAEPFNRSQLHTVIVVALTSNLGRANAPGNVLLPRRRCGLPRDSVANVSQVITLDREDLIEYLTTIPPALQLEVDAGLRRVLSL